MLGMVRAPGWCSAANDSAPLGEYKGRCPLPGSYSVLCFTRCLLHLYSECDVSYMCAQYL